MTTSSGEKVGHTKGPWEVERLEYPSDEDVSFEVKAVGRYLVAQTIMREKKTEAASIAEDAANMRLVASAPDLLDACKQAEQWLEGWGSAEPQLAIIRAAISKAEGR